VTTRKRVPLCEFCILQFRNICKSQQSFSFLDLLPRSVFKSELIKKKNLSGKRAESNKNDKVIRVAMKTLYPVGGLISLN
jgi:AAA+ ATPase superfamily predicted ATPase